ncbi:ImmA/IrrE family metallo-endopeptidase [Desulfolutivibrio sulfoxidireducens]|uniref:ImmA/IrrE family metallo-endopeptidase n=1 Tax=Desulfolutivibrio sulfoxidireducens TaxID=2773299 RepID=UPI00159E6E37|nr:ImmA/IrrE family metallo-endopeptidase [Desulfolutivibrio sulfoxidireducens]QLA20943.1 ImmA/IrrE family metallo-endopeptidase [Desulfolutivibrio sulfoxidireducens]
MESPPDLDRKALDELFHEVGSYRNCNDFKELYEFIKKFPKIAPYNALLIHIQRPGSRYVATVSKWKKDFGRSIKPGARPIIILKLFGPVQYLFELSDTIGETPLRDEILNPFKVQGNFPRDLFETLLANLPRSGISYHPSSCGTSLAGSIEQAIDVDTQIYEKKQLKVHFHLIVNNSHSNEEKFATITHELGHLYCGHLGTPDKKWWPDRSKTTNLKAKEFEAESVAWLVCERAGIKNPSAQYLSGYLENNQEIPDISIEAVLKATGMIEAMTMRKLPIKKELIVQSGPRKPAA